MFIKIGDSTTLPSTEEHENTFITPPNEHTVQNQSTSGGKTFIDMFTVIVKKCKMAICENLIKYFILMIKLNCTSKQLTF